jgi:hypothetical protein
METKQYSSIIVSSMPYPGERGPPGNPSKPVLEMVAIESDVCS